MNKYSNTIELIVRLIIKRDEKILLCINKKAGNYFLPGGHVEFGDSLEKTIYKETREELGWTRDDIKSFKFKGYHENSYFHEGYQEQRSELNMIFDAEIGDDVVAESKEPHIGFEWVDLARVPNIKICPTAIVRFVG